MFKPTERKCSSEFMLTDMFQREDLCRQKEEQEPDDDQLTQENRCMRPCRFVRFTDLRALDEEEILERRSQLKAPRVSAVQGRRSGTR